MALYGKAMRWADSRKRMDLLDYSIIDLDTAGVTFQHGSEREQVLWIVIESALPMDTSRLQNSERGSSC